MGWDRISHNLSSLRGAIFFFFKGKKNEIIICVVEFKRKFILEQYLDIDSKLAYEHLYK